MVEVSSEFACTLIYAPRYLKFFRNPTWKGQAFAVDEYHLLTNKHVVGKAKDTIGDFLLNGKPLKIQSIINPRGDAPDLALIRCVEPHGIPIVTFAKKAPKVGELSQYTDQDGTHHVGRLHAITNDGAFYQALFDAGLIHPHDIGFGPSMRILQDRLPTQVSYYMGFPCRRGDSGSAVYNKDAEVVGVLFAISTFIKHSLVVPLEDVQKFLKENLK